MAEALLTAAMAIDGGYFERVVAAVSSHHYSAERQFRFPTEQGVQRSMSSQWTVTGAGAVVLEKGIYGGPRLTCATIGKIIDLGQKDANDPVSYTHLPRVGIPRLLVWKYIIGPQIVRITKSSNTKLISKLPMWNKS